MLLHQSASSTLRITAESTPYPSPQLEPRTLAEMSLRITATQTEATTVPLVGNSVAAPSSCKHGAQIEERLPKEVSKYVHMKNSFNKDLQTFESTGDTVLDVDWQLRSASIIGSF